jgi:hypothetical protein
MYPRVVLLLAASYFTMGALASPAQLLRELDTFPHATRVNHSVAEVLDYEIGLGAIRKVSGTWRFKNSERKSGELTRYTWQIIDGFSSNEVLEDLEAGLDGSSLLFGCEGRSCGKGVQWANRVFHERVLYGRDDLQRYRVYGPGEQADGDYRVLLFSSSRTADRHYLHAEFLVIEN